MGLIVRKATSMLSSRARGKTCVIYDGHDVSRFQPASDAILPSPLRGEGTGVRGKVFDGVAPHPNPLPGGEREHDAVLVDFGLDRRLPYILAVGGIEPRKNTINMLRACIHLRKHGPELPFQLILVGEVHALPGFALQVERARQFLPVVHAGYKSDEDVARLLAGARALLFPSLWEGFGIPQPEAMTAGALVITSDLASMPEVCREHAIYCDPYEPRDIAAALARCLEMPEGERLQRVQTARRHASRFTWERMGEQVIQLLRAELACTDYSRLHAEGVRALSPGQRPGSPDASVDSQPERLGHASLNIVSALQAEKTISAPRTQGVALGLDLSVLRTEEGTTALNRMPPCDGNSTVTSPLAENE